MECNVIANLTDRTRVISADAAARLHLAPITMGFARRDSVNLVKLPALAGEAARRSSHLNSVSMRCSRLERVRLLVLV